MFKICFIKMNMFQIDSQTIFSFDKPESKFQVQIQVPQSQSFCESHWSLAECDVSTFVPLKGKQKIISKTFLKCSFVFEFELWQVSLRCAPIRDHHAARSKLRRNSGGRASDRNVNLDIRGRGVGDFH